MVRNRTCTEVNISGIAHVAMKRHTGARWPSESRAPAPEAHLPGIGARSAFLTTAAGKVNYFAFHFWKFGPELTCLRAYHAKGVEYSEMATLAPSLEVLRVKETSCSSKEVILVKIHW